jgi:geranylgeranyl pyrophosphate synthase
MAIDQSLQAVNDLLLSATQSPVLLLSETTRHILSAGGKRLRPRLVLLAHAAVGGEDEAYVVPLAAAVEIIHTATLVHDDINDHGTLRRGRETVNSRWGGTFALLTGDFMFTKTYEIMAPYAGELNAVLARAAIELVEGETLQIQASRQGALDRDNGGAVCGVRGVGRIGGGREAGMDRRAEAVRVQPGAGLPDHR